MNDHTVSAVATGSIAIATSIGLMSGFYYNLKASHVSTPFIVVSECILIITIITLTYWIRLNVTDENTP